MESLDFLPKPFFLVDYSEKRVTYSNAAARKILGLEYADQPAAKYYKKQITAYTLDGKIIPIENLPSTRVARGEKVEGEEILLETPTGRYNIKVFSGTIPAMYGRPAMGLILFQDITALKKTEQSLLQAQADLNEAVETAMVGFWSLDTRTMKTQISEQLKKQFDILPGEFEGTLESVSSRIHPEDLNMVLTSIRESIETGKPYKVEYRVLHRNGDIRWIEAKNGITGASFEDHNRFAGTTLDITERVNARLRLEASEQEFRLLADSMPQIVWSANPSGELDYFNQVWFDYSGANFEANKGSGWLKFVHPEDRDTTITRWKKALETKEHYENEFRLLHYSGEYRWHVARARAIFSDERNKIVKKWYGTNTDIHDQKLLSDKLADAREIAERANSAKSQFLANMSHEIRTPLGAIIGFTKLIKEEMINQTERESFIAVIERNSAQLLRIIDDILDLSKVEAGMMQFESIEFSLQEMLTDFSSLMGYKARAKDILFTSKAVTPIPRFIISDPTRVRQILMNIVGNAIKFTDRGHVELRIGYSDGCLEFEVEDTGRGISDEQALSLFKPFTQADPSTTRKYGGTGLGLSLTRSLAEALGGSFELKSSSLDAGSTFVARIKVKPTPDTPLSSDLDAGIISSKLDGHEGQLEGTRILLVEDAPDNQTLITIYLSRSGTTLDVVADGLQGYQKAIQGNYDLILMDVQMPVMDGIEAVKKLRSDKYDKPIIALTAHAMKEERERCIAAGFTEFLTKPVSREELLRMIQAILLSKLTQ